MATLSKREPDLNGNDGDNSDDGNEGDDDDDDESDEDQEVIIAAKHLVLEKEVSKCLSLVQLAYDNAAP